MHAGEDLPGNGKFCTLNLRAYIQCAQRQQQHAASTWAQTIACMYVPPLPTYSWDWRQIPCPRAVPCRPTRAVLTSLLLVLVLLPSYTYDRHARPAVWTRYLLTTLAMEIKVHDNLKVRVCTAAAHLPAIRAPFENNYKGAFTIARAFVVENTWRRELLAAVTLSIVRLPCTLIRV